MSNFNISNSKDEFDEIFKLIIEAKRSLWQQINKSLIKLYWDIGKYISVKGHL